MTTSSSAARLCMGGAFTLQHCPKTFHLVIATRSDPPLPLTCLRARGQTVELYGLLERIRDLNLTLISLTSGNPPPQDPEEEKLS